MWKGLESCLATLRLICENEHFLEKVQANKKIKHRKGQTTTRKNEALEKEYSSSIQMTKIAKEKKTGLSLPLELKN